MELTTISEVRWKGKGGDLGARKAVADWLLGLQYAGSRRNGLTLPLLPDLSLL